MYDINSANPLGAVTSTFIRTKIVNEIRDDVVVPYLTFEVSSPKL